MNDRVSEISKISENRDTEGIQAQAGVSDAHSVSVTNTTVNNTNIITNTIACIDYVWRNSKVLFFMFLSFALIIVLTVICLLSLNSVAIKTQKNTEELNRIRTQLTELDSRMETVSDMRDSETSAPDSKDKAAVQNEGSLPASEKPVSKETEADDASDSTDGVVTTSKPNNLYEMKIISSKGAEKELKAINTIGGEINNAIVLQANGEAHVTYYLGGEYSRLTVNLSCPDTDRIYEEFYSLNVFADNDSARELYTCDIGRNMAVKGAEIDVEGVEFITFRISKQSILYDYIGLIISDSKLE